MTSSSEPVKLLRNMNVNAQEYCRVCRANLNIIPRISVVSQPMLITVPDVPMDKKINSTIK